MNRIPPWLLAVTSILSVQLSSALAVGLFPIVGPTGTAWLRLTAGALIFIAITRPPLRSVRREDLPALVGLGVTTGLVTMSFLAAIDRIPLGTAVAIEFLGPLTVAALRSHNRRALAWPALALAGVLLLTEPWHGEVNAAGLLFAAVAAVGWATYIVLTQHVGDRFSGISGLSITVPIAALTATPFGMVEAAGNLSAGVILAAIGLAILLPVLPLALEMIALREMTPTAFGTLMALEPAFAVLLGALVLHQTPAPPQILGIVLVVLAGAGAQRGGRRVHELELVD
ncbi:MAG: EamA family transporter [Candidatus Nanopelagicales bacterium]